MKRFNLCISSLSLLFTMFNGDFSFIEFFIFFDVITLTRGVVRNSKLFAVLKILRYYLYKTFNIKNVQ